MRKNKSWLPKQNFEGIFRVDILSLGIFRELTINVQHPEQQNNHVRSREKIYFYQ